MLKRLTIKNYALIREVEIEFGPGLTIITGSTGAGKSVMLGALHLLTGSRVDSRAIHPEGPKATVEASFTPSERLRPIFEANELDWDDEEVIVRREISPSGRSRAFINDTPVNLKTLGEATANLIDIHSQNANTMLNDPRRQLEIIDAVADNIEVLARYRGQYHKFVAVRSRLRKLQERLSQDRENENYLRFQLSQLDNLKPRPGELAALEKETEVLNDAEDIRMLLGEATSGLDGGEGSVLSQLADIRHTLSRINFSLFENRNGDGTPGITQRLEQAYVELKDINASLEDMLDTVDADPERLLKAETRLMELYDALKRFNCRSEADLVALHKQLREREKGLSGTDGDLEELEKEMRDEAHTLKKIADELSETRAVAAEKFAAMLCRKARPLAMPHLKFSAMLTKGKLTVDGQDNVSFLCSFNKNQELMPVAGVASGGETSRLMLGIKAIIADHVHLPSVIFDEVDTGVSGDVADRMGRTMADMSRNIQVVAITHLPQIAAMGRDHYLVYKSDEADRTVSRVRRLAPEERVAELARMLSGSKVEDAAVLNARSLLEKNVTQA